MADDVHIDGREASGTISTLARALSKVSKPTRYFKSVPLWTASFVRYLPAAVAAEQMTLATGMVHMDMCLRISEECRMKGEHAGIGIVYDELKRRSWAEKAKSRATFDIEQEARTYDEEFVRRAKTVLSQRIAANTQKRQSPGPAAGGKAGAQQSSPSAGKGQHLKAELTRVRDSASKGSSDENPAKKAKGGYWSGRGKDRKFIRY
jgi:hypothetical protein